jgi:hypothetical protein
MVLPRFRYLTASEKSPDTKTPPSTLRQSSSKLSKAERMELMRQKSSWTEAAPDSNIASYSRDNIHYSFIDGLNAESKPDHDHAQIFSFSLVEHCEEKDNASQDSQSTTLFPECHDVHIFAFRATSFHCAEQTKTLDLNYCAGEDDIEVESVQQEVPLQHTRDLECISPDKTTPVSNRLYTTTSRADLSEIPRIKANSSFTRFFAKSDKAGATKTKQTSQAPRNNDANSIVENPSMRIDQVLSETDSLQDYQEAPPPPRDGFALLAEELSLGTSPTMSTLSTHMFRLYDPGTVDTLAAVAPSESKSAGDVPSLPLPTPLNKSERTTMPQERAASRPKLATRGVPPTLVVDDEDPGRDRTDPLRVFHAAGTQQSKKDKAGRKAALLGTTLLKSRRGLFARRKTKEPMSAASKNNQPISDKMSSQASLKSKNASKIQRIEPQFDRAKDGSAALAEEPQSSMVPAFATTALSAAAVAMMKVDSLIKCASPASEGTLKVEGVDNYTKDEDLMVVVTRTKTDLEKSSTIHQQEQATESSNRSVKTEASTKYTADAEDNEVTTTQASVTPTSSMLETINPRKSKVFRAPVMTLKEHTESSDEIVETNTAEEPKSESQSFAKTNSNASVKSTRTKSTENSRKTTKSGAERWSTKKPTESTVTRATKRQLPPALPLPRNRRRPFLKKGAKSRQSVTGEASTKASVGRKLSGARSIRSTRSKKKVPMTFKEKTLQASLTLQSQRSNETYDLDQGYDCCNPIPASAMASSEHRRLMQTTKPTTARTAQPSKRTAASQPKSKDTGLLEIEDDRNDDDGIDHSFCGGYNNDQDSVDRDRDPNADAFLPAGAAAAVGAFAAGAAVVAATTTMTGSHTKEPYQDNICACPEGGSSDPEESTPGTADEQEDDVGTLTGKTLQLVRNNRAEQDALADDLTETSSVTAMSSVASHTKILPGRGRRALFGAASFSKKSSKLSMIADDDDDASQSDETEEDDQSDSTDSNSTTSSAFVDHRMTSRPRAPQTDEASAATTDSAKAGAGVCDDPLFQLLGGISSRRQRKGETSTVAHQQPDDESFDSGHDDDALFYLLQRR